MLFGHGVKDASAGWAITMAPAVTIEVSRPTIPALVDLRIGGLLNRSLLIDEIDLPDRCCFGGGGTGT